MSTETLVKSELHTSAKTEKTAAENHEYRSPEVHDLGKLELMKNWLLGPGPDFIKYWLPTA